MRRQSAEAWHNVGGRCSQLGIGPGIVDAATRFFRTAGVGIMSTFKSAGMKTELELALAKESTPRELPMGLPLAHLTARRWLQSILKVGQLEPRPCTVLAKKLLYFSYGGVFYR